jgi:DNA modification methylase
VSVRLLTGDCRTVLVGLEPESIDAIVTDPPYGLSFMGKEWDSLGRTEAYAERGGYGNKGILPGYGRGGTSEQREKYHRKQNLAMQAWHEAWATAAYRVLKPGGHLVAFGGTRTFHRLTCALEDAGFEIRDCLSYMYGSGFPKSASVSKAIRRGLPAALLASARRSMGTGEGYSCGCSGSCRQCDAPLLSALADDQVPAPQPADALGRSHPSWPSAQTPTGTAHRCTASSDSAAALLDASVPVTKSTYRIERKSGRADESQYRIKPTPGTIKDHGDTGGPSRFFYTAKASRSERNAGLAGMPEKMLRWSAGDQNPGSFQSEGTNKHAQNHHPTVKPVALMRWLVRLITPRDGVVLDPFMGSGTTGIACVYEERSFIGIEREAEYVTIAHGRIARAQGPMFTEIGAD